MFTRYSVEQQKLVYVYKTCVTSYTVETKAVTAEIESLVRTTDKDVKSNR